MSSTSTVNTNACGDAFLYSGSATAGIELTSAVLGSTLLGAAEILIIGILVVILFGIALIIENVKDNPVQDRLERSPWGILKEQRYSDLATQ